MDNLTSLHPDNGSVDFETDYHIGNLLSSGNFLNPLNGSGNLPVPAYRQAGTGRPACWPGNLSLSIPQREDNSYLEKADSSNLGSHQVKNFAPKSRYRTCHCEETDALSPFAMRLPRTLSRFLRGLQGLPGKGAEVRGSNLKPKSPGLIPCHGLDYR